MYYIKEISKNKNFPYSVVREEGGKTEVIGIYADIYEASSLIETLGGCCHHQEMNKKGANDEGYRQVAPGYSYRDWN